MKNTASSESKKNEQVDSSFVVKKLQQLRALKTKMVLGLKPGINEILLKLGLKKYSHPEVFSAIYKERIWGQDDKNKFYSGTGSDDMYSNEYVRVISEFIQLNNVNSVVDLGCGDFRVGRKITELNKVNYTGVDVAKELIEYNNLNYKNANRNFLFRNIVSDPLPQADLCLIRQVLQHLSNSDIKKILKKCSQFKYLIITEHQSTLKDVVPNIDKPADKDIRLNYNSAVYLDKPPFNKKVEELLTTFPEPEPDSKIVTYRVFI